MPRRFGTGVLIVSAILLAGGDPAAARPGNDESAATISGSFADACQDFAAQSSKDISHVEIHYADGVVKDESIDRPDFAIDGSAGDEIERAAVKSGTTTETFACQATPDGPPTAVLEILTPETCIGPFVSEEGESWSCDGEDPRTVWRDLGDPAIVFFGCEQHEAVRCDHTVRFRGASSTDPDGDIVSWTIEFTDALGAPVASSSGDWATDPPTEVALTVPHQAGRCATLTVIDAAGHSDSETICVVFDAVD